jgi:hypothetical protein
MIDENCAIWKQGKGFCWCPSSAWGVTDPELCELCQIKNAQAVEKIEIINTRKLNSLRPRAAQAALKGSFDP